MKDRKRKPVHPGIILQEHYIIPLELNLQELADHLEITRNTLFKIRMGYASITPSIAITLADAFDTTPQLWLNLQQKFDLWVEENEKAHSHITPIFKNGSLVNLQKRHNRRKSADEKIITYGDGRFINVHNPTK
jgi:addiction module HigA family antidote